MYPILPGPAREQKLKREKARKEERKGKEQAQMDEKTRKIFYKEVLKRWLRY